MITAKNRSILAIMLAYSAAALLAVPFCGPLSASLRGLCAILTAPAQLTIDYFLLGTVGGTLLNVGLVGLSCTALFAVSRAQLSGTSLMAFFLTIGFSFFGINLLNIWPCLLGTWLYTRAAREPFAGQVNIAVFSTALAPFVSEALFRYPAFSGQPALRLLLGVGLGALAGFLMPMLCRHSPNLHKGYTLYNAAAVAGFIGILLSSLMFRAAGVEIPTNTRIGGDHRIAVLGFALTTSLAALLAGFLLNGRSAKGYAAMLRSTGHRCDFTQSAGVPLTLMHTGAFGLFATAYYVLTGAPMTGPTLGSIVCLLAIAPCGAHALNMLPIMLGYALAARFASFTLGTQAIVVGLCFAGALCPVSGRFGALAGVLAGALHACMVTSVVTFHCGLCLYNGGFTCGITALLLVPVLETFFTPSDALRLLPLRRHTETEKSGPAH